MSNIMTRIFQKISFFGQRLKIVWILLRHPDVLIKFQQFYMPTTQQLSDQNINKQQRALRDAMPIFVNNLLPTNRHEMRYDDLRQPFRINIKNNEIMTSDEADRVLKESVQKFIFPTDTQANKLKIHNTRFDKRK